MAKWENNAGLRLIRTGKPLPARQASYGNKLKRMNDELENDRLLLKKLCPVPQDEEELARLDRLRLLEEMSDCIGHEVKNPLTTVRGFLQLYRKKKAFTQYHDSLDLMIGELDRANAVITECLSLINNKVLHIKPRNLNKILANLAPLYRTDKIGLDKHIVLQMEEIPDIPLEEKEIRQLVLNLVRNGLEAMPPSGVLTIRTYREGKEVVFSVQDQGKGIAPDQMKKLGTPFFTTKESGTGLGLAVCYRIAARHNAVINIETSPAGTTFLVRFKIPQQKAIPNSLHLAHRII
ncbi:MAG: Sensor protein ZraS [Pelotomaculum sp. PtaB.Bin104]|nr:MAG: Sensor protein ZraS [Pelotomaculum sp. PtaB.Bin104]